MVSAIRASLSTAACECARHYRVRRGLSLRGPETPRSEMLDLGIGRATRGFVSALRRRVSGLYHVNGRRPGRSERLAGSLRSPRLRPAFLVMGGPEVCSMNRPVKAGPARDMWLAPGLQFHRAESREAPQFGRGPVKLRNSAQKPRGSAVVRAARYWLYASRTAIEVTLSFSRNAHTLASSYRVSDPSSMESDIFSVSGIGGSPASASYSIDRSFVL